MDVQHQGRGKDLRGKTRGESAFYTSETLMVTPWLELQKSHCYQEGEVESLWVLFIHVKPPKPSSKGVVGRSLSQVRRMLKDWVSRICRMTHTTEVLATEWTV